MKKIDIQHQYYKPSKIKKVLLRSKKFLMISFYLSLLIVLVSFAETGSFAFAKSVPADKASEGVDLEFVKTLEYYSRLSGNKNIAENILKFSAKNSVEPSLLAALIRIESNFNPNAINRNYNGSTDRGLCQLNSNTFKNLTVKQFYDPAVNIENAAEFLKWCLTEAEDDVVIALAYYNAGYGSVSNSAVKEITLNYINKILHYKEKYESDLDLLLKS